MGKFHELREELKSVFSGRGLRILDSLLPLIFFLIAIPQLGLNSALWGAIIVASLFMVYRISQRESLVYSIGGISGVLLASIFVSLSGSERGFFVPGLISGAGTALLCVVSVVINRPLVAWTSHLARRWPLGWYWHHKILPAYNEVTILWGIMFAVRMVIEVWLIQRDSLSLLGTTRALMGWPFTIVLLIISYLYGQWRLAQLQGPSVEEYISGKEPPWLGQKRGF